MFVINPGSTSTRFALFEETSPQNEAPTPRCRAEENVPASGGLDARLTDAVDFLERNGHLRLDAVVARGGLLAPVSSGTIAINEAMLTDAREARRGKHASNLGCLIAHMVAGTHNVPSFIVDPVSVDEMLPEARLTGLPEVTRQSLSHVLNLHAAARQACRDLSLPLTESRLIVAHLGGGFSIVPMAGGRILDTNNANSGGPFAPTRAGTLPTDALVRLCFSGQYTEAELLARLTRNGGLRAHLNTDDARQVEDRISAGDEHARLVYDAMGYQIAKEIGAFATVLKGRLHAIVLTGGLVRSNSLCERVVESVGFLGPVLRYAGEFEMLALAEGAFRVLRGEDVAMTYPQGAASL